MANLWKKLMVEYERIIIHCQTPAVETKSGLAFVRAAGKIILSSMEEEIKKVGKKRERE